MVNVSFDFLRTKVYQGLTPVKSHFKKQYIMYKKNIYKRYFSIYANPYNHKALKNKIHIKRKFICYGTKKFDSKRKITFCLIPFHSFFTPHGQKTQYFQGIREFEQ